MKPFIHHLENNNGFLEKELCTLVDMADNEVNNHLCRSVPFYQSYAHMHIKHKDNSVWKKLEREATHFLQEKHGYLSSIDSSWFNVTKKDSDFGFHSHQKPTVVFYLKNCAGNGTIYKVDDGIWQPSCADNTFCIVEPGVVHATPNWNGVDRYSIAFTFSKTGV